MVAAMTTETITYNGMDLVATKGEKAQFETLMQIADELEGPLGSVIQSIQYRTPKRFSVVLNDPKSDLLKEEAMRGLFATMFGLFIDGAVNAVVPDAVVTIRNGDFITEFKE